RVAASQALTLAAQESIHVHGGMGVTWELDAHLYLRRARAQSAWLGHVHHWREVMACELEYQLDGSTAASRPATAAAARDAAAAGSMDFDDSPDEARFRQECREWLQQHAALKSDGDEAYGADLPPEQRMQAAREWQACKARAGYGAITWPRARRRLPRCATSGHLAQSTARLRAGLNRRPRQSNSRFGHIRRRGIQVVAHALRAAACRLTEHF
ncbi:MAG: hypothetical protein ACOVOG_03610, partial [Rubrivivax sp.]